MLQIQLVGHLGADCETKTADGREFTTYRVAHTERYKDQAGDVHETTTWVDCIMDGHPSVANYLRRGTQVFVTGSASVRLYSSPKDKCMKAGLQVRVRNVELLGGRADDIPGRLFDANDGHEIAIFKFFQARDLVRGADGVEFYPLVSMRGDRFVADRNGWVSRFNDDGHDTSNDDKQ